MSDSIPQVKSATTAVARGRVLDYVELMKPELTGLSVLTVLCGYYLGSSEFDFARFAWTAVSTFALGSGLGALNQFIEMRFDQLMKRTERRPLPSLRIPRYRALVFGSMLVLAGLGLLAAFGGPLATFLGILTFVSYVFLYTPLKRRSWLATMLGGVPGALPPLIGWAAAAGTLGAGAWALFGVLYFWQIPHFLALAWMYKKDYARAGFRALPVSDESGRRTGMVIVVNLALLIAASAATMAVGLGNHLSLVGSLVLGCMFAGSGTLFLVSALDGSNPNRTNRYARWTFLASLVYLPFLMTLLIAAKS